MYNFEQLSSTFFFAQVPEFLAHVDRRLEEESQRIHHYLDHTTRKPLIACVEKQLLEVHIGNILQKGWSTLVSKFHSKA